ncbi:hypothetical protein QAD02_021955 [Eretmocerus hayati]|uniref:Uncharacterized protein n=1 Tax=Eretmocerus hayati TaxID=131215 RepID=A0ACC2PT94_9HYME|nr:hypothetical protein QAD02_021955 [Eretmocerus hayati]
METLPISNRTLKRSPPSSVTSSESSLSQIDARDDLEANTNKENGGSTEDRFVVPKKSSRRRNKKRKVQIAPISKEEINPKVSDMIATIKLDIGRLDQEECIDLQVFQLFLEKSWGRSKVIGIARDSLGINVEKLKRMIEVTHTLIQDSQMKTRLTRLKTRLSLDKDISESEDTDSSLSQDAGGTSQ